VFKWTKNRTELLRLFLTNPNKSFYMHEIGRILGRKPGTFQRVLYQLAEEGVLVSRYSANARYFQANKSFPLYRELRSIVFKTIGVTGSIGQVLNRVGDVELAFIYGSYARGRENYLSDIDLVIVGNADEDKLIHGFDRLEDVLKRDINYKLYRRSDFEEALAKKSPFLQEVLRDKKVMIVGNEDEIRKIRQSQTRKKG